jgi:hypothetical protein
MAKVELLKLELAALSTVPTSALVVLAVVALIELGLDAFALVDLYRRPTPQVAALNKWIWVVIILLVNPIGAILYLAIGRKPPPAASAAETPARVERPRASVENAVDSLYGTRDPADRS